MTPEARQEWRIKPFRIHRTAKNLRPRNQSAAREFRRTPPRRIYRPLSARIIAPMTRHKHTHTGLVTPQLPQLWLTAVLRLLAMLVQSVCSTLQMIRRPDRVNATRATPPVLPRETSDTNQETHAAQPSSPIALMLRRPKAVSNHAGVLTAARHKLAQHERHIHMASPSLRSSRRKSGPGAARMMRATGLLMQPWIPAFAGKSGLVSPPNKNAAA